MTNRGRTIIDYSRPMPAGFALAGPWMPAPPARPAAADRCDGSLQLVMSPGPATPCPVCGAPVDAVELDGAPVLVEHRRRSDEALPMTLAL